MFVAVLFSRTLRHHAMPLHVMRAAARTHFLHTPNFIAHNMPIFFHKERTAAADDPDSINLVTFDGTNRRTDGRRNERNGPLIRPLPRDETVGSRKNFRARRSSY